MCKTCVENVFWIWMNARWNEIEIEKKNHPAFREVCHPLSLSPSLLLTRTSLSKIIKPNLIPPPGQSSSAVFVNTIIARIQQDVLLTGFGERRSIFPEKESESSQIARLGGYFSSVHLESHTPNKLHIRGLEVIRFRPQGSVMRKEKFNFIFTAGQLERFNKLSGREKLVFEL